ncbi:cytochrome P450 [Idiomarina sp.]|uniref:cytochrome P450 n=1 Tax=Idiomarina sp. TaxID=1874361 RepID=UPI001DA6CAEE|nr:cytochrome P450 [Idiomarina sp.]MCJ8317609.1 cytochrome P450 [Idiomarina sp.]NQZ17171.1 cytochrome P450 [Idiomarina sp.]
MKNCRWEPSEQQDQIASLDELRQKCPVAQSEMLGHAVLTHSDVRSVIEDHETFSNAAGSHLSVPNGMDPPEHGIFREVIEPYFKADRLRDFEPTCRQIAQGIISRITPNTALDVVSKIAKPFALHIQSAFLGWPESLTGTLGEWLEANQQAIVNNDRATLKQKADEFEALIHQQLDVRRQSGSAKDDNTCRLMHETVTVNGETRRLHEEEVVSILRNWTAGEVGTIAAAIGSIFYFFAQNPDIADKLRNNQLNVDDAIDEILRIDPPLISNRRRAVKDTEISGCPVKQGEKVTVLWASANRDESVFGKANTFNPEQNKAHNLLYGRGIHVCPGAPLARMELRIFVQELLEHFNQFELVNSPIRANYPSGGFINLSVRLT